MMNSTSALIAVLILSSVVPAFAADKAEKKVQCIVQLARANTDVIEYQPRISRDGLVTLVPNKKGDGVGRLSFDFEAPEGSGAPVYRVELELTMEQTRSVWVEAGPRLTVATRLINLKTKQLLSLQETNSDQVLTPAMAGWLRDEQGPRVIAKLWNPDMQNRLEQNAEDDLRELIREDIDAALKVAISRGHISRWDVQRIDTVCMRPVR